MPRFWHRIGRYSSTAKLLAPRIQQYNLQDAPTRHIVKRLPLAYQKFYEEWQTDSNPIHWIPSTANWKRDERTGAVSVVRERPIPVLYPHQSDFGLWGGEGVVDGMVKKGKYRSPVPRFWVPALHRSVVYSQILDKHLSVTVTNRALKLIDQFQGLDNYLIQNPANELKSLLALKLKRRLLEALASRNFATGNPEIQAQLLDKYKDYILPADELEWYGLSVDEAKAKYERQLEDKRIRKIVPLKVAFREELLEKLKLEAKAKETMTLDAVAQTSGGWLKKLNPFSKPEQGP